MLRSMGWQSQTHLRDWKATSTQQSPAGLHPLREQALVVFEYPLPGQKERQALPVILMSSFSQDNFAGLGSGFSGPLTYRCCLRTPYELKAAGSMKGRQRCLLEALCLVSGLSPGTGWRRLWVLAMEPGPGWGEKGLRPSQVKPQRPGQHPEKYSFLL